MYITKAIATSLALGYLAAASTPIQNGWSDIAVRQGPAERIVQIVTVSDNNSSLKFFPENIQAEVGSVVQFQFYPKNHTITESSFADPCKPIASNLTSETRPGQKSGFVPVTADTQFRPVYNLIVNDTKPMWIFCGQMPHCQKGMSMVINQNMTDTEKTLEKYKEKAAQIAFPSAGAPVASGVSSAVVASTPAASASAYTVTPAVATATGSPAGPSLAGTVASAAGQSASATASIAVFQGGATAARDVPVVGLLAAGAVWALL